MTILNSTYFPGRTPIDISEDNIFVRVSDAVRVFNEHQENKDM